MGVSDREGEHQYDTNRIPAAEIFSYTHSGSGSADLLDYCHDLAIVLGYLGAVIASDFSSRGAELMHLAPL